MHVCSGVASLDEVTTWMPGTISVTISTTRLKGLIYLSYNVYIVIYPPTPHPTPLPHLPCSDYHRDWKTDNKDFLYILVVLSRCLCRYILSCTIHSLWFKAMSGITSLTLWSRSLISSYNVSATPNIPHKPLILCGVTPVNMMVVLILPVCQIGSLGRQIQPLLRPLYIWVYEV